MTEDWYLKKFLAGSQ